MFLISAFGRSGTHYTSRLLQAIGIDAPHEKLGNDGGVSWKHIVPGEFRYLGKRRVEAIVDPGFDAIIHQVREPLKVLSSSFTFSESTWHYMEHHLGLIPERDACQFTYFSTNDGQVEVFSDARIKANHYLGKMTGRQLDRTALLRRAMRCYAGWNELIEQRATWRFKVEELSQVWPELLARIGLDPRPLPELANAARDSRVDRDSYRSLGWQDLYEADNALAAHVREIAYRYTYQPA